MKKDRKLSDSILEWLLAISKHSGKVEVDNKSLFDVLANEQSEDENKSNKSKEPSAFIKQIHKIRDGIRLFFKKVIERFCDWSIYKSLSEKLFYKRSFRFVTIIATLFFVLVFTVHFAIVFINDVILFDTELNVNEQGALNPRKALNCEHAMYLFNPSEVWANTGIRLNKGDKYRITISGGANTTIYEAIAAANNNVKPLFKSARYDLGIEPEKEKNIQFCLSKGARHLGSDGKIHYFNFGTVMYTIQPEGANVTYNPLSVPAKDLRSWNPGKLNTPHDEDRDFHKANNTGFLYLAVNDIVFGNINKRESFDKNNPLSIGGGYFWRYVREQIASAFYDFENRISEKNAHHYVEQYLYSKASDNIDKYINDDFDYFVEKEKQSGRKINKDKLQGELASCLNNDYKYFYNDNFGQILVSVEIQRSEPGAFFNPMMAYRDFETRVAELPAANVNASFVVRVLTYIWSVFVFIWYLLVFFCHITLLYAIGAIQLWLAIVLLFIFVGFLQHLIFGDKKRNKSRINKPAETPETS